METFAAQLTATPPELMTAVSRFVIAAAIALALSVAWIAAGHESHDAVQTSGWILSGGKTYVKLPTVEIVGHRA